MSEKFTGIEKLKAEAVLTHLNNAEEVRDWMQTYLGIKFPMGIVYPESTHGPVEAMWEIYNLIKSGGSADCPEVVMLSSRDSYKCNKINTLLMTPNGFKKIQDIKLGDIIWSGWNWQKVTDWIDDGVKQSVQFELKNGLELSCSPIHRYWCLREGVQQWIQSSDILETDLFCTNTDTGLAKKQIVTNENEFDIGYFLGLIVGDGSTTLLQSGNIGLCNGDPEVIEWFCNFCTNVLKVEIKDKPKADIFVKSENLTRQAKCKELHIYGGKSQAQNNVYDKLVEWGLKPLKAHEKEIPSFCYTSHSAMVGFISGLFDSDGTYNSKNQIEIPITAKKVVCELQKVLIGYGINARVHSNKRLYSYENNGGCKQNHLVHRLYITANEYEKFFNIGVKLLAKKAQKPIKPLTIDSHDSIPFKHVQDFIDRLKQVKVQIRHRKYKKPTLEPRKSAIYESKTITYSKLNSLLNWFLENREHGYCLEESDDKLVVKIQSILKNKWFGYKTKKDGEDHFFDLTVEEDHSYWSNGVISHNTLSAAALEALCIVHFQFSIAHAAAVLSQSEKAVQYNADFFKKLKPYLEYHGWKKLSDNKTKIEWELPGGRSIYLRVLVMTTKGMNSEHLPMLFLDEIDLVQDVRALEEAKMVPSVFKHYFPLTVSLSTRKYKGGLMEKKIKEVTNAGGKILRWNIIDVTERISYKDAQIDKPKVVRYISRDLPMRNLTEQEFKTLTDKEQQKFERFEAYAGIADHQMLPVMRNLLVDRPQEDIGDLYKPLVAVHNNFKLTNSEMADAQLLCNRPSSSGLVYPRFSRSENVLTVEQALKKILGDTPDIVTIEYLMKELKDLGVKFVGSGDFGFTNFTTLFVTAILPSGDAILLDSFVEQGLELDDIVKHAVRLDREYSIAVWWLEQAYPAYLKTLRKPPNSLKIPAFKKVVEDGIAALQNQIVSSANVRKFFILDTPNNKIVVDAFDEYRWALDGKGDVIENKPYHDKDGVSDIMDGIRYIAQNEFIRGKRIVAGVTGEDKNSDHKKITQNAKTLQEAANAISSHMLYGNIQKQVQKTDEPTKNGAKKRKIMWY